MVRRKDPLWDHVDELDNQRFRCKFCGRNFAGGIPRIKSHLSCITGRGIDVCTGVPDDVRDYAISEIGQPSKKARTATTSVDIWENGASPSSTKHLSGTLQQNAMPAMHGNDRTVADKNLARFLLYSNIPYDVLEAPCFSDFIRSVAECGRDYKLPNSSMLETTIFPDIKTEVETHVRNVKESWMDSGCTVLVEVWHNSITIIAYSLKGAVSIKSFDSISEKSDFDIKDTVSSVIEDIGYDNVVQLITNNDRVFHSVGDMLGGRYPRIYMTRCVAHEIHLLLKNIYDNVGWVKLVIDQAALVVKYMYGDANILSLMRKFTSGRELKHLCMSKFSSSYIMLRSIFDNETELRQLVASVDWSFLHENNEREDKVTEIIQSGEFWTQGQDVQKVMKPFFQVLCLVEDERSTSPYLYEVMERAKEAIEGLCNNDQMKYKKILEIFEERRSHIIQPIHAAAAFLNPAYMCHGNFKENREMKAGVDFILRTMVRDDKEKKNLSNQFHLYRAKAPELFTKEAYEMLEMHHPGLWWDYRGDCFPVLQKYATRILRQPCKCSLHLKYSAFVVPENVKMSTTTRDAWEKDECMKMNAMMMEKFRSLYKRNLEPIELQNCSELPGYVNYDKGCGDDADNCDDCNKTNGSGQMVFINARSADHTTNQLDVFCKADERAWKDLLSDNIARLKDGIPEGLFPDTSEIHNDYQALLHQIEVHEFSGLSTKVETNNWNLKPTETSQQKDDGRSRVDSTDKASGLPSRKENDEAEELGDEPDQQLASNLNSHRAVISSATFSNLSSFIRVDNCTIWSTGQDKAHNSNEWEPNSFGDTDSIHNAPVDRLGVNWKGSPIAFSDSSGSKLGENYNCPTFPLNLPVSAVANPVSYPCFGPHLPFPSTGVADNSGALAEWHLNASASAPVQAVVAAASSSVSVSVPQCQVWKRPRTGDPACQRTEIVDPGDCRLVTLPDATKTTSKVVRLLYTNSGEGILSLQSNGAQNLWKWPCNDQNPRGKVTASAIPQHWRPNNGLLMTNDILGVNLEEAVPCMALSKNDSYVMSAAGGKVSLFNILTFKVMTTFMPSPPASTFLALHPQDNNVIAIGMEDSTIRIFNVRIDEVTTTLKGHQKRITGLVFSNYLNILVSSGADAQLCMWNANTWETMKSVTIQIPAGKTPTTNDTQVQFHSNQTRLLVVHETHLAVYDASSVHDASSKMDRVCQWIPEDELPAPITGATYSCNSQLIYATFSDGNIGVFDADTLRLRCRIASSAYMLSQEVLNGSHNVHPLVVVAHPMEPNQLAIGLTNGSVKVMEPTESEGKWGSPPLVEDVIGLLDGATTLSPTTRYRVKSRHSSTRRPKFKKRTESKKINLNQWVSRAETPKLGLFARPRREHICTRPRRLSVEIVGPADGLGHKPRQSAPTLSF